MRELPAVKPKTERPTQEERRLTAKQRTQAIRKRMHALLDGPLKLMMQRLGFVVLATAHLDYSVRRPRADLDELRVQPTAEGSEHLPSYEHMRAELERLLGRDRLRRMIPTTEDDLDVRTLQEGRRAEEQEPRLQVRGFEQLGFSNESVRRYVVEGFPRTWTSRTAVTAITYAHVHIPMPEQYGIHGYEAGHCTLSPDGEPSEIVVTPDAIEGGLRGDEMLLSEAIPHELAHGADWLSAAHLDPRVRLELLWRVVRHLQDERRVRFPYVESIHNDDPQQELEYQAREFVAESVRLMTGRMSAYQARELAVMYGTDIAHMEEMRGIVRRMVPGFDWEAAQRSRAANRTSLLHERMQHMQEIECGRISDPRLREAALDVLRLTEEDVRPAFRFAEIAEGDIEEFGEGDMDEEELELWDSYSNSERAELGRLRVGLPPEAKEAFDRWQELVKEIAKTRGFMRGFVGPAWHDAALRTKVVMERVDALNDVLANMHDDRTKTAFDVAAHRALRIMAAGDVRLPPGAEERMVTWMAERVERVSNAFRSY